MAATGCPVSGRAFPHQRARADRDRALAAAQAHMARTAGQR
jgi:hypothetical protein